MENVAKREQFDICIFVIILVLFAYCLIVINIRTNQQKIAWCYDNNGTPIVNYNGGYEKCILGDKENER